MMNLVVRRDGRENNFKSVLETIRGLMDGVASISRVMPPWLQLLLLGCGDPSAASYKSSTIRNYAKNTVGVTKPDAALDYGDTFLDEEHLRSSFTDKNMRVVVDGRENCDKSAGPRRNYKVKVIENNDGNDGEIIVEAFSYDRMANTKGNPVRFTPLQVEAIRSGLSPGLTLVVGPPGTGALNGHKQSISIRSQIY